ncbi:MAG: DNA repair and recombination protein RadB [Methanobacteriota archaeon]
MRVPFAVPGLDALLRGGIEPASVTEIYGAPGTGKTQACLQLSREAAARGRVLYLDTEGVSVERFQEIAAASPKAVRNVLFVRVHTLADEIDAAERAARILGAHRDVRLIVWDSATLLYRVSLATGDGVAERRALLSRIHGLSVAAAKADVPLVLTNQVYEDVEGGTGPRPLGGFLLSHLAKTVIRLERALDGRRRAVLVKHRALPENSCFFAIGPAGLVNDHDTTGAHCTQMNVIKN